MTGHAAIPSAMAPEVYELRPAPAAADVFRTLSDLPHCLFLDSALPHPRLGRYSYVAADPFVYREFSVGHDRPLDDLASLLAPLSGTGIRLPELPAFQGGAGGLFAYDLGRSLEVLPAPHCDDFQVPLLAVGLYDTIVAFDHLADRAWIISQGWPAREPRARRRRARARLAEFRRRVEATGPCRPAGVGPAAGSGPGITPQPLSKRAVNYPVGSPDGLLSNFTADGYRAAVARAIEHIYAGDIFQVNLAQRLLYPAGRSSTDLYLNLRRENPAPFAGYFDLGQQQIVSASPERFLRVEDGQVETRPIKGTRPRSRSAEADLFAGDELQASEKDRAENTMIVDLMRNDLSRVCAPDSVTVTQLCELETYQFVQHLVSAVIGQLAGQLTPIDLIRASFPGGSITGAPKIRAMQIIAQLEPHARGAYCGSLGYLSWDGSMDLNILIRTITAAGGWWQFPVGGGIVAQSNPQREYQETWHKAEGLLRGILA